MSATLLKRFEIDWVNVLFLVAIHILGFLGIFYILDGFLWQRVVYDTSGLSMLLGLSMFFLSGLSMTAGYHRLYSHRAFQCSRLTELFFLCFGAAAFQNNVLKWVADHRRHHGATDEEGDPYNIQKGFWWAHIGWIAEKEPPFDPSDSTVSDLRQNPLVMFQYRLYIPLALFFGFIFPAVVAAFWSDGLGGFLIGGCLRLVVLYHSIFSVNSFAHMFGSQPYTTRVSARDSWWVAFITLGEGYHNYHHRFPRDFRNGVYWWQFDPGKWFVWCLERTGHAWNAIRVPEEKIASARVDALRDAPVHFSETVSK